MEIALKNFTIDIVDKYADTTNYIRLTAYKNGFSSIFSSFNEELTESENGQYLFNFAIELFAGLTRNPYVDYLTHGRQLRLTLNDYQIIDFNITSIQPIFGSSGIQYQYKCQDSFSYQLSSQSVDLSFSTDDTELWGKYIGPKKIDQLLQKVLEIAHLDSQWSIDSSIENHLRQFPNNLYDNTGSMKVSVNIEHASPFNIIVQIVNTFNALIEVDYVNHIISAYNKERRRFKGFNLLQGVNLSNFNYSESSDNLYNLMYVSGGEDAYGIPVTLLEPVPESLYNLFINLDHFNVRDSNNIINKDKKSIEYSPYYPDFIVGTNNDEKCIYYKKYNVSTQSLYYDSKDLNNLKDTNDWRSCKTILELKNLLLYYCNLTNEYEIEKNGQKEKINIYASYQTDQINFNKFFQLLEKLPHYGSFLKDFTYWKNTTLSNDRYNILKHKFDVELRNLNILSAIYNNMYNKYSYKLKELLYQEEEIVNRIGGLLEQRATLTETENNSISSYSYFATQSVKEEQIINYSTLETRATYYLPISEWLVLNDTTIHYNNFTNFYYESPDLSTIGASLLNKNIYYKYTDSGSQNVWGKSKIVSINYLENTITIDKIPEDDYRVEHGDVYTVLCYINLDDIKDTLNSSMVNNNAVIQSEINSLIFQLENNIWTSDYFMYYQLLYGSEWLTLKSNELHEKIISKKTEYNNAINNMQFNFGTQWRSIDVGQLATYNISQATTYSSLFESIKNLAVYIGGVGTRKDETGQYYTYPGWYSYYYDLITEKLSNYSNIATSTISLKSKCDEVKQEINNWWKNLYSSYHDVIRECIFSDADQLTNDGLYNAAQKQFMKYQKPATSYSASYIALQDLDFNESAINVGDSVNLYHQGFTDDIDPRTIIVELDRPVTSQSNNNISFIEYCGHRSVFEYELPASVQIRGMACGTSGSKKEYVATSNKQWLQSFNGKDWTLYQIDPSSLGIDDNAFIITGVVFYDNVFWATVYNGKWVIKKSFESTVWEKVAQAPHHLEGIVLIQENDTYNLYCYGEHGYIGKLTNASGSYVLESKKNPSLDKTISNLLYCDNIFVATTTTGEVYNLGKDLTTLICTYDGASDLRALHYWNNTIFIGGNEDIISSIDITTFKNLKEKNNSLWEVSEIPEAEKDYSAFIRGIVHIGNNMFALGYYKQGTSTKRNFFWTSTDMGRSWVITQETMHLNITKSPWQLYMAMLCDDNNLYFGGAGLTHYIEPVLRNTPVMPRIIGRNVVELTALDDNFSYPNVNIKNIYYNNRNLSLEPLSEHIISISKKTNPKTIKLRINEITKTLRQNQITLKIEENTLYNTLFDKLLFSLRNS